MTSPRPPGDKRVVHLAVFGGPSAGKSTVLSQAPAYLTERGWRVLVVPEPPTLLISGGLDDVQQLARTDRPAYLAVQREILGLYLTLHHTYARIAEALGDPRVVVLHDRGALDVAAYSTQAETAALVAHFDHDLASLTELYDGVLYLESASLLETGYVNTHYRTESRQEAAELDAATRKAWLHHPHLAVVGAHPHFTDKMQSAFEHLGAMLGEPPIEFERKFVVHQPPPPELLTQAQAVEITQDYLVTDTPVGAGPTAPNASAVPDPNGAPSEARLRHTRVHGSSLYVLTHKDPAPTGRYEHETPLDEQRYRTMLACSRDPRYRTVEKTRYVFIAAGQRFELDHLHAPREAWLLEAELLSPTTPLSIPAWIGPVTEVTDDPAWKNRAIAAA